MGRNSKTKIHADGVLLLPAACYVQTNGHFLRQLKQLFVGHLN